MSVAAPGVWGMARVTVLLLFFCSTARSFEGAGSSWGGTAFAGPPSGALPRASRSVFARCPRFYGRYQQGTVTHMGLRTQTYLHRARMSQALGKSVAPPPAPELAVADKEPSVSLDETTEVTSSVAVPVDATEEAPRMPMRRGRGIGKKEVIDVKPRSRPLDDGDLEDLIVARKARASKAGRRRAERLVPEMEPRRSLRERFLISMDEKTAGATGGVSTASEGGGSR